MLMAPLQAAPDPKAELAAVRARYALGRLAQPEEIASAALFLSGADSSFVTGIALAADGGRTFH
jgi:NAD(P)-dependent dehydrogenase (short-subunit alcohol dehydrogenase family)